MPNIKSAKKRVKQDEKRHMRNVARKSEVKKAVRKVVDAVKAKDLDKAREMFKVAQAKLSRAKGKGVMHGNAAARKISRLAKQVETLSKVA